jgi:hypothetical protein
MTGRCWEWSVYMFLYHGNWREVCFASDSKEKSAALESAIPKFDQEPIPLSMLLRKSNYLAGLTTRGCMRAGEFLLAHQMQGQSCRCGRGVAVEQLRRYLITSYHQNRIAWEDMLASATRAFSHGAQLSCWANRGGGNGVVVAYGVIAGLDRRRPVV